VGHRRNSRYESYAIIDIIRARMSNMPSEEYGRIYEIFVTRDVMRLKKYRVAKQYYLV
jgi:hypothetical protein